MDSAHNAKVDSDESDDDYDDWDPTRRLVPVFCTINIPSATLDFFLGQIERHNDDDHWVPVILESMDPSWLERVKGCRSQVPMRDFTSPFDGMTLTEVNHIFLEHIKELDHFTVEYFIVLDRRSVEDHTCLIVEASEDFELDNAMAYLRTDFADCIEMLSYAEIGVEGFEELGAGTTF